MNIFNAVEAPQFLIVLPEGLLSYIEICAVSSAFNTMVLVLPCDAIAPVLSAYDSRVPLPTKLASILA